LNAFIYVKCKCIEGSTGEEWIPDHLLAIPTIIGTAKSSKQFKSSDSQSYLTSEKNLKERQDAWQSIRDRVLNNESATDDNEGGFKPLYSWEFGGDFVVKILME